MPTIFSYLHPLYDSLQKLDNLCEHELSDLDLSFNVKKSVCTRIGPRCNVFVFECCPIGGDSV